MMWRGEYTRSGMRKIMRLEDDKERYPRGTAIEFEARDDQVTAAKEILAFLNTNFPMLGFNADDLIVFPRPEPLTFNPVEEDAITAGLLAEPDDFFIDQISVRTLESPESAGLVFIATNPAAPDIEIRGKMIDHDLRGPGERVEAERAMKRRIGLALWGGRVRDDD